MLSFSLKTVELNYKESVGLFCFLFFFYPGFWRDTCLGESGLCWIEHSQLVVCAAQWRRRRPQDLLCTYWCFVKNERLKSVFPFKVWSERKVQEDKNFAVSLNCRSQRAYCLIEVHLDFLVWLEASPLLSMVGPATELILSFLWNSCKRSPCPYVKIKKKHSLTLAGYEIICFFASGLLHMCQMW